MKISRNTAWITGLMAALFLSFSLIVELCFCAEPFLHASFCVSIALNIFAGALLSLITALVQYFRLRNEHFFMINSYFDNIWLCVAMPLAFLQSQEYLQSNIRRFERSYEKRQEMTLRMNDYHTFLKCGFHYNHIESIHDLVLRPEFLFWSDFDNAVSDQDYLKSFETAHRKYVIIKNDFDNLKGNYDRHVAKSLRMKENHKDK